MAQVEPMDVDGISTDFDDKENSLQNGNVLPKTPSNEKGFEDLDVSELNMKLRYSMTPASSPMSRSFTAISKDNNMCDDDSSNTTINDSGNLTWSLNSTITKMNSSLKSPKFPLQVLSTEQFLDGNGNPINRSLDIECTNVTLTLTGSDNIDDNLSLPSNSSSMVNTPEATTPTKEIPKDSGSPILRGLKSVLNMFRPSQSPIPVEDTITNNLGSPQKKENLLKHTTSSPSTPTTVIKNKENNSRNNNSVKESVVFHDDLEKELSWKDETGIIFKEEKIPIHKLLFKSNSTVSDKTNIKPNENMNNTVEYMDVSFDNSLVENNKTITKDVYIHDARDRRNTPESDCEFLDCESYTKNDSKLIGDTVQIVPGVKDSSQNSPKPSLQPESIICESIACPQIVCNSIEETCTTISNNENDVKGEEIKETDLNYKQNLEIDLSKAEHILEPTSNTNIPNEISQENIPKDEDTENLHDSVHCDNETINLDEEIILVTSTDKKHDSDVTSNELNNTSQCALDNSLDRVEIIQTIENNENKDEIISQQTCDELLRSVHLITDNPSVSSECQDDEKNNVRLEEQDIITKFEEPVCIESEIKEVPEIVQPCQEEINENKETDSSNQKVIINVSEFNEDEKSPEQVPLPCDSEDFNNEQPEKEIYNTTINFSIDNTNSFYSQENINTAIAVEKMMDPENITISSENTPITETSHLEVLNNTENFNTEMNSPNNSIVNDTMTCTENDVLIQETDFDKGAPLENAVDTVESRTEDSKNLLNSNLSPVVDSSNMVQKPETQPEIISISTNTQVNNKETIDDNCVRIDESIPLSDNMLVTNAETNEYTSENKNKITLTLQKNTSETDDRADLKLDPANNLLDVNNKNEETIEIISPSAISNTTIETEEDISKKELENIENPFETVNKLTSSFEINSSLVSQVEKQRDFSESLLKNNENEEANEMNTTETVINTTTDMEVDISKDDLDSNLNPFETINKLTSSFEIKSSLISSNIEKQQDFSESLLENHKTEEANEVSTTETVINTTTEMEVDISKHDLDSNLNPFETINKLTSSFDLKSAEIDSNVDLKLDSANSLLDVNHTNENVSEESVPETVINTTIDMEVDVSKHDLEINMNSLKTTENEHISPLEEPLGKPVDNEIVNKIDLETNDQLSEATACDNIIGTEEVVSNCYIDNIETLKEDNLNAGTFETRISTSDSEELVREQSVETTSTICNDNVQDAIISSTNCDDDSAEKIDHELVTAIENLENQFETKIVERCSPPISSMLRNTGYNINFDDIGDPFATKSNIRMSPPPSVIEDNFVNNEPKEKRSVLKKPQQSSRRKSCQERKKPKIGKKANASFDCVVNSNETFNRFQESPIIPEGDQDDNSMDDIDKQKDDFADPHMKNIADVDTKIEEIVLVNQSISTNSSSKNVFNLPEIHDINFNPFATKTKIRQSPDKQSENISNYTHDGNDVPRFDLQEAMVNKDETFHVEENNAQVSERNLTSNLSNVTCSSPNTKDATVQEVHTEDEDTEEGPFLEAEDFADFVKVTDIEIEKDMMNFDDLPTQSNNDDNNDNGEMFIDAEAFEFLLNQNKSNMVADSGKESLFLKFDPLFAKRVSSDGVVAALNKIKNRQSTPKKPTPLKPIVQEDSLSPEHSTITISTAPVVGEVAEDPVATTFKPMMVVNPAVASIVSPRKSTTPPRANRRSLNITSPAMAVIDRLLSLSGNSSRLEETSSVPLPRHYNETDFALTQLRELLAEKEINVHNLRLESKELKERLANMETQVQSLEHESKERLRKVNELNERLTEKNAINKSLAGVVEEYERTIARLIAGMEQDRKRNAEERQRIISERDEQTAHLASMEVSFRDLHSKYEKSKQIILNMKANEDKYRESLKTFEDNLLKMQNNYELLKQHATSKLNHANQELEKYNRSHEAEVLKLNAMIKRKELHITSLEESLSQKTKANEELTAICDELINKVG